MITTAQVALPVPFTSVLVFTAAGNAKNQTEVHLTSASGNTFYVGDATVSVSTGFPVGAPGSNIGQYSIQLMLFGGDSIYAVTNTPAVVAVIAVS